MVTGSVSTSWYLLCVQLLGVTIAVWGVITIRIGNFNIQPEVRSTTLIQHGPYRWIRNPMYTGILLFFLPVMLTQYSITRLIIYIALIVVFLLKIFREEQLLKIHFGKEYDTFMSRTKRLIPFIY